MSAKKHLLGYLFILAAVANAEVGKAEGASTASRPQLANENDVAHERTTGYIFSLNKGKDVPVCEAYLQRLNRAKYDLPPFCGRPLNDDVKGFQHLDRAWVPNEEINKLYDDVVGFLRDLPAGWNYKWERRADGLLVRVPDRSPRFADEEKLSTFRYAQPIDIDNDGTRDDVLVWNEDRREDRACGREFGPRPMKRRAGQFAIILNRKTEELDKARTTKVFGHPSGGIWLGGLPNQQGSYFHEYFRPIGSSYEIFEYSGIYYFNTFFDGRVPADFNDLRKKDKKLLDTLAVFRNMQGHTEEICEYDLSEPSERMHP